MWTSVDDIRNRWLLDEDIPASDAQITELIEDAEDTIIARFPDIQARVDSGAIPQRRVVKVAASLVLERLKNPRGTRQKNETTGPFTESETFGGTNPGEMVLSESQIRELSGGRHGGAFTVNTIPTNANLPGGQLWH